GRTIVPVWVTECEVADLPEARDGTGLCGRVGCARGDCWPRYAQQWAPLVAAAKGPIAAALWSETFHRDPEAWPATALALFRAPPRGAPPIGEDRAVAVVQAWGQPDAIVQGRLDRVRRDAAQWVIALDAVDQSWAPRVVGAP